MAMTAMANATAMYILAATMDFKVINVMRAHLRSPMADYCTHMHGKL